MMFHEMLFEIKEGFTDLSTELVSRRAINQLVPPANMDVPFFSKGFAILIDKHAQRSILGRA